MSGFNYDGNGADTFFWAGAANRPGPQGFIVPDEFNTYVLLFILIIPFLFSIFSFFFFYLEPTSWIDILIKTLP